MYSGNWLIACFIILYIRRLQLLVETMNERSRVPEWEENEIRGDKQPLLYQKAIHSTFFLLFLSLLLQGRPTLFLLALPSMVLPRGNAGLQPQYTGTNRRPTLDPNAENKRALGDLHVVIPKRLAADNPRQPLREPLANRQRVPLAPTQGKSNPRPAIAKQQQQQQRPQPHNQNQNEQRIGQRRSRRHAVVEDSDVPKIILHKDYKEYYTKLEYLGEVIYIYIC